MMTLLCTYLMECNLQNVADGTRPTDCIQWNIAGTYRKEHNLNLDQIKLEQKPDKDGTLVGACPDFETYPTEHNRRSITKGT